ncbi:18570_t:CDS:1, partial [Racocetra persica]
VGDQITITPYEVENENGLTENQKKELDLETKRKGACDTCQKKLGRDNGGSDNFYIIKRYLGKMKNSVKWACRDCYPTKEAEYLQNYAGIYERFKDENGEIDYRLTKAE